MKEKIIFLDIDGTLIDFSGHMPESAAEALRLARSNGHQIVLCSGRNMPQVYPFLVNNPNITGMVTSNGSCIYHDGEQIYNQCVESSHLRTLIDYMEHKDVPFYLQTDTNTFCNAYSYETDRRLSVIDAKSEEEFTKLFGEVTENDDIYGIKNCNKILFYKAPATLDEVQEAIGDYFMVTASSFNMDGDDSGLIDGEISIRECQKDFGMKRYLEYVGASREDSIAFGDGPNDFEMMKFAGTSVAMGNAVDELKKIAHMVTTSVGDDGIYNGFKKLGLI